MISETLLLNVVVLAVAAASTVAAAEAGTVTLQQGADGYTGCTTRTLGAEAKGLLPLRGAKNRFVVRFEIPNDLAGKKLARARLGLFLPAAKKMNVFTELLCREITADGPKPTADEKTDYDNGRPAGAVDSVELFAPKGSGWVHQPWLPLGVPAGGRWIEFNVTRLAEKWMADAKANHGVMIVPTDCPDKRFRSTWQIDIPAADAADAAHRPRLTLEPAPPSRDYLVGTTHGLRRILDRSTRYQYRGGYGTQHKMSMAANELEGFQVVVYPMLADLANVRFTWTDLTAKGGGKIPRSDVECFREDFYRLRQNWKTRDLFFRMKLYDVPDPLIPASPVSIRRHMHTAFYFRVRTRPKTAAGVYRGTITLRADGVKQTTLALEVKVWPYAIPVRWNFHTMGQLVWECLQRFHGKDFDEKLRRKYYDFLLENRFAPTEQYYRTMSPRADLADCLKRGMNTIYLSGNFTASEAEMARLKGDHEKVRKLGALDHALVYVGDETSKWSEMHRRANLVHAHLPGVQVMIGGSFPRKELQGYIDIYDPQIGGGNKVFSLQQENAHLIGESQQRGEEFYWYVAAGPHYPHPNVQVEYPLVIPRVLFWMTWKYGVTGFEYYCYNIWHGRNFNADPAKRYPHVKWKADGWEKGWPSNGDGMLFYPGPVTSLRLEAIRDGIEDWESHQLLADCVEGLRRRKQAGQYRALLAKARKLLKVKDEIVTDFTTYTLDPDELLAAREELGEFLAKVVPVANKTLKWDTHSMRPQRAAEVRIARVTARRRRMLRQRHLAACEALKVAPLTGEQWQGLWPKRVLFSQDFESDPGEFDWTGEIVTDNVPPPGKRAVLGHLKNKYFARRIRVGIYWDNARAATHTWVKFKYFINKAVPIGVFVFDMNKSDNFRFTIRNPVVGKWTEVTLKVADPSRGGRQIQAGDALDDVFVHAGKPGDADLKLYVDDVQLIGLD